MDFPEQFYSLGCSFSNYDIQKSRIVGYRRYKALFGVSPLICSIVWHYIKEYVTEEIKPYHLLWGMGFLKCYNTEHVNQAIFGVDEKTFRKWTWIVIKSLASLKVVNLEKRFAGSVTGQSCYNSLDGVDFRICEPTPFNSKWFSHNFKGPGLRYELAICIRTGHIIWANGPYHCGQFNDLQIVRDIYLHLLNEGELTVADMGYRDPAHFINPNVHNNIRHKQIMSTH